MLTKIGWLEQDQSDKFPFQTPIKEIQSLCKVKFSTLNKWYFHFFKLCVKEPTHRGILALKLLTSLIEEMDSVSFLPTTVSRISFSPKVWNRWQNNAKLLPIFAILASQAFSLYLLKC